MDEPRGGHNDHDEQQELHSAEPSRHLGPRTLDANPCCTDDQRQPKQHTGVLLECKYKGRAGSDCSQQHVTAKAIGGRNTRKMAAWTYSRAGVYSESKSRYGS